MLDDKGRKRKLSLGPIAGNAARFDYWPDPTGRWGIAEGCKSAIAAYALTDIPTWAAISAGNMPQVVPPSWARHATIFADRDAPGINAAGETLLWLHAQPQIETVRIVGAAAEGKEDRASGFTHQRSEVERYARSGNFRALSALR